MSAALDGLDAAFDRVAGFDCQALTTPEQLALLERFERLRRRIPAVEHPLINAVARQATPEELGGKLSHAIAEATLISRAEAARRIKEAADLGPRHALSGEPLAPVLAATAAAQREGTLGTGQVAVIRRFYHQLPGWIDAPPASRSKPNWPPRAPSTGPSNWAHWPTRCADALNPDGTYTDEDRARRRGLTLGNQGPDEMSQLRGWLTPEARATLEAVWAKLAAPGMCNPNEDTPTVDGPPSQEAIDKDTRGADPTPTRRTQRRAARVIGVGKTRSAQWVAGLDHRHHHPAVSWRPPPGTRS